MGAERTEAREVENIVSLWFGSRNGGRGRREFDLLYLGHQGHVRTLDRDELFDQLENVLLLVVGSQTKRNVFLHAGVVEWKGSAVLLPGPSACGKTSLVASLVEAGAGYVSDEVAVLDEQARVLPYPRPLRIRRPGAERRVRAEVHGSRIPRAPLEVGAVLFTRYDPEEDWRPKACSPARSVVQLLEHVVGVRREPALALETLGRAASRAVCLEGSRGEARQVVDFLRREDVSATSGAGDPT